MHSTVHADQTNVVWNLCDWLLHMRPRLTHCKMDEFLGLFRFFSSFLKYWRVQKYVITTCIQSKHSSIHVLKGLVCQQTLLWKQLQFCHFKSFSTENFIASFEKSRHKIKQWEEKPPQILPYIQHAEAVTPAFLLYLCADDTQLSTHDPNMSEAA